ncbi:hypothetical protein ACFSHQ_04555 [Gemmobacter lanyuensis]
MLRRAVDALRDGDHIWAILKGSAVNNDGAAKAGYLAPSVEGRPPASLRRRPSPGFPPIRWIMSNVMALAPIWATRLRWRP